MKFYDVYDKLEKKKFYYSSARPVTQIWLVDEK